MEESSIPHQLKWLANEREDLGLKSKSQLVMESGSADDNLSKAAQKELNRRWGKEPEKSAENAETVDLIEMLDQFSGAERTGFRQNLVALQLTSGCNGECPFCLFGIKKGVDSKFSYESVSQYIRHNAHLLGEPPALYWDSDPFDWRDGEHDFNDIYQISKNIGDKHSFISTAVPKNSEDSIKTFLKNAAEDFFGKRKDNAISIPRQTLKFRFSVARHNIQRIESVVEDLVTKELPELGYSSEEIQEYFNNTIEFNTLLKNSYHNLGALIKKKDAIGDLNTPACRDGIVISPNGVEAIMMVAPSIYDPSGQRNISLSPGNARHLTPKKLHISEYHMSGSNLQHDHWISRTLPGLSTTDNLALRIQEGPIENLILSLSREAFQKYMTLRDIAGIGSTWFKGSFPDRDVTKPLKHLLFNASLNTSIFKRTLKNIRESVVPGKVANPKDIIGITGASSEFKVPEEVGDKLEYYITLAEIHTRLLEFVGEEYKRTSDLDHVCRVAGVVMGIGKKDVENIEQILLNLSEDYDSQDQ